MRRSLTIVALICVVRILCGAEDFPKPYSAPCTERENVFAFTEKPAVKTVGVDLYEITFAVKGNCDVTVGIVDGEGRVERHLGSGVLGANAPAPFQKDSLRQKIIWNGKNDLDEYVKEANKMKVRVMLGLKPEFDKRMGVTNPKSIPGGAWALCSDESGVYVFYFTVSNYGVGLDGRVRKFDHDGNYVRTLLPPPANQAPEKLQGLGCVEYEAGRKALHTPDLMSTCGGEASGSLPHGLGLPHACQPAIVGNRIYYCTIPAPENRGPALLHYVNTDGSFEAQGVIGQAFLKFYIKRVFMAASPDRKWLYLTGSGTVANGGQQSGVPVAVLFRTSLESVKPVEVIAGEIGKTGSDNGHLQNPSGLDCDPQGRIYVSDHDNNRVQVFTPEGKYAKSIPLDRPTQIKVHSKTGAIYVMHSARVQGASVNRISKLTSYDNPEVEFYMDCPSGIVTLDSWTAKPRIWLYDGNIKILEEDGKQFRKIADFEEEVKTEVEKAGGKYAGGWSGSVRARSGAVVCDPLREQVVFNGSIKFDLRTGEWLGAVKLPFDDIAFDKYGYLHGHYNPSFEPGVVRLRADGTECPYDYGVEGKNGRLGILPCRDQLGAKFFQDGIGVNMRGDVAENCNIYYAPKRGDNTKEFAMAGGNALIAAGAASDGPGNNYSTYLAEVQRRIKSGEELYYVKPAPGVPLMGATIWTFNRSGELRDECAVITGDLMNGVMIDEDYGLYFVCDRTRVINNKPFLAGHGGFFGVSKDTKVLDPMIFMPGAKQREPFTGTLIKTAGKAKVISPSAPIGMDQPPERPPELSHAGDIAWCNGAEWFYAGASPIVPWGCSCPTMRFHTDWYKRTFVPEAYRHSIGVLDTAGNLILHVGQYGNFDSGYGPTSKVPVGGDGIALSDVRWVSSTDNYLVFCDRGERIIVLKLNYHADEAVGVGK